MAAIETFKIIGRVSRMGTRYFSFLAIFSVGCATSYHAADNAGSGYSDLKVSSDTYKVMFRGDNETSSAQVKSYFLRRCAEVTRNNGFEYFTVLDEVDKSASRQVMVGHEGSTTRGSLTPLFGGVQIYRSSTTVYHPTLRTFFWYLTVGTIRVFKEGRQPADALNADKIIDQTLDY